MKKINLLFVMLLSLMGVTQVQAQVTDDFTGYPATSSGQTLGDNWYVFPGDDGNYGRFGSDYTYKNNAYDGADYNYVSGYTSNYNKNVWLVLKKQVTGSVTFRSKMGRSTGTLYVTNKVTAVSDGTFTVDKTGASSYDISTTAASNTYDAGSTATYVAFCLTSDQMRLLDVTYTEYVQASGPALAVSGDDEGTLAFGMVDPGTTKELTLSNPGSESISVSISTTGGFTANPTSATIAAGGNETLSIAAPTSTGSATGTVTITPDPAVDGIDPVTISLSAVIKDPNKMFEDFSGNALPTDWTATGSYSWSFNQGYAKYTGSSSYAGQLTTPAMIFESDETLAFEAAGNSSYEAEYGSNYAGKVIVQISTDGTNFSDLQTFSGIHYNQWQSCSVTIPAGTTHVRFVGSYVSIDNVYGGQIDNTPRPKLEVVGQANGSSLSWGYSDVPAGTTKTITLKNDGTADLDVTIAATDDYTVDPETATVVAGGTVDVTIGTPAHDGNGVLTITPAEESGLSPYTINLTSYYKEPKPVMSLDKTTVAFGKVNEVKSETITVSNTGDGELVATITNDNSDNFTVEPAELTVAPGETGTITITYNFVEGTWGTFNANVKVTPNYGSTYDVKTITVSATSKNPDVWDEDFEEGTLPESWLSEGKWTVSQPTASGSNGTYMAYISSYNAPKALTTPCLEAKAGDQLTFYIGMQYDDEPLTIEYSADDRATWNVIEEGVESYTESGTITFTAPADGTYYLRFTGTYAMLDDFNGFKLFQKAHDALITSQNIPATGNQYVEYTATVTVKEMADKDENVKVEFYFGETKMGEVEGTLDPKSEETFEVKFIPEEAFEGEAYFKVTFVSDDDEVFATFNSDPVAVTIAAAPVLDEATGSLEGFENWGNYPVVSMKYSLKAGWNTIILPFAWSDLSVFGEGAKVYEFTGYTAADGISFNAKTSMDAQTPYVLYAPEAKTDIVFTDVKMFRSSTEAADLQTTKDEAVFQGSYAPVEAPNMQGKYGVVPSTGKIAKGGANAYIKGFRAYFELPTSVGEVKANFFEADGTVTSIEAVKVLNAEEGAIYDLSGRKVEGKAKAGVYIQNGKKIVVK